MKVLLTGATGFIGSFLAEYLLEKGYQVRCLVRTSSNLRWIADLDVECHYGSLDDIESLKRGLNGVEYVFHLAGITKALKGTEFVQANYQGTKNLARAVIESKAKLKRFLFVSSQAAVGPSPTIEFLDETSVPKPMSAYGKSKLAAEQALNSVADQIPVTIVRPPVVFGPRDTDVLNYFKTLRIGLIPKLDGREKYVSLIYVKDLVRGILLAANRKVAVGKTYFLTAPRPYSWEKFGKLILQVMNKKGFRLNVPSILLDGMSLVAEGLSKVTGKASIFGKQRLAELKQDFWVISPHRAKTDLKFETKIPLEQGISETLSWYIENRWL